LVRRFLLVLGVVSTMLAAAAVPVAAAPPSPGDPAGAANEILGIVPTLANGFAKPARSAGSNLSYHNGPVMRTNQVYAIYWVPAGFTVSSSYKSLIDGYFTNVAADNGKTSNVYYSDTQYSDTTGRIAYSSSLAGSFLDTNPLPASGCSDSYTSVCVTDAQLQTELQRVMSAQGWTAGSTKLYFIFTARGIGSCAGSACSFSYYCAYHSWIGSGSSAILYANMPYADTVPAACDAGQHPNNDDADATLNVTSHEHNEAITDAQGSAWYDRRGYENGDKCAWNFGTTLGSTGGTNTQYNQVIGTGKYFLQQEWSNARSGCVLTGV
jgi:hypothetical protein